jgi:hypothetical protein
MGSLAEISAVGRMADAMALSPVRRGCGSDARELTLPGVALYRVPFSRRRVKHLREKRACPFDLAAKGAAD